MPHQQRAPNGGTANHTGANSSGSGGGGSPNFTLGYMDTATPIIAMDIDINIDGKYNYGGGDGWGGTFGPALHTYSSSSSSSSSTHGNSNSNSNSVNHNHNNDDLGARMPLMPPSSNHSHGPGPEPAPDNPKEVATFFGLVCCALALWGCTIGCTSPALEAVFGDSVGTGSRNKVRAGINTPPPKEKKNGKTLSRWHS